MTRHLVLTLLLFGVPTVGGLRAQRLGTPFPSANAPAPPDPSLHAFPRRETHPAVMAAGGLIGGAVGVFAGGLAGVRLTERDCEDCGIVGAVYGAIAGGSALLPLGVHVANRGRGNFGLSLLSSLAIGGAGLAIATQTNSAAVMIPVPVLQIVTSILIERRTGE
jgi:hypothetical protein